MSEPSKLPPGLSAGFDQFGAILRDLAPVIASYWKSLRAEGIPRQLAVDLVLDFHRELMERFLGEDST